MAVSLWSYVCGLDTTVNQEFSSGHIGRLIRSQKQRGLSDLPGFAEPAHGNMDKPSLPLRFCIQEFHEQFGSQRAWAKRVYPDALTRVYYRELASQRQHGAFACGIRDLRSGRSEQCHK